MERSVPAVMGLGLGANRHNEMIVTILIPDTVKLFPFLFYSGARRTLLLPHENRERRVLYNNKTEQISSRKILLDRRFLWLYFVLYNTAM